MRQKLILLHKELDDSIPKCQISSSRYFRITDDDISDECRAFLTHLQSMKSVDVKPDYRGVDVIRDTPIRVLQSVAFGNYVVSAYGKLVIPASVTYL